MSRNMHHVPQYGPNTMRHFLNYSWEASATYCKRFFGRDGPHLKVTDIFIYFILDAQLSAYRAQVYHGFRKLTYCCYCL